MSEKSFVIQPGPRDRIRHWCLIERGQVREFTVQYEARLDGEWKPVVRYDTAHGFAHRDLLHPDGRVDKRRLTAYNLNVAFTYAAADVRKNWEHYRERYVQELYQWKKR